VSKVEIEKVDGKKAATASVLDEIKELAERVRERAFELFERRGRGNGFELEDWFNAERDLVRIPEAELIEKDGKFEVRMNAPGFDARDIKVTALPDALIVRAESTHRHDGKDGNVRFCEFGQKTLFRRFDLPETIDVDKVSADLDKGVLHLTASKAKHEAAPKPQAIAA
jgi:HSP20 family protein